MATDGEDLVSLLGELTKYNESQEEISRTSCDLNNSFPEAPGPLWTGGHRLKITRKTVKPIMTIKDNDLRIFQGDTPTKWNDMSWKSIHLEVKNLRFRIFTAARNKEKRKLRNLQNLMISSKVNLLVSIHRVTARSTGRKTPGIDADTRLTPKAREDVFGELVGMNLKDWLPQPVKRIYLPKPDGRRRPIGIPTIKDRIIQAVFLNALEPEWEAYFEPSSYGFRPGKSYRDASAQFLGLLAKKTRLWVVEADITGCFDNIDHDYLFNCMENFPGKALVWRWLKAGIMEGNEFKHTEFGTPQGGIISPLLSNIALHGLEKDLNIVRSAQGFVTARDNPRGRTLVRYADDFVVLCPSVDECVQTILDLNHSLKRRGLELSSTKTKISHISEGVDFLGFEFRQFMKPKRVQPYIEDHSNSIAAPYREYITTVVTPSDKSMKNYRARLSKIFHEHRGKLTSSLISKLNRSTRGYGESKRQFAFTKAARSLDHHIYQLQLHWAKARHPKKNTDWSVKNYFKFHVDGNIRSSWTFHCNQTGLVCQKLHWNASIRNWPQVVGSMSPDDRNAKDYWETRRSRIFASRCVHLGSTQDRALMKSQEFLCPVCEQPLFDEHGPRGLHRHHVVPRAHGGDDKSSNLLILHQACHVTIHAGSNPGKWIGILSQFKLEHPSKNTPTKGEREENPYLLKS